MVKQEENLGSFDYLKTVIKLEAALTAEQEENVEPFDYLEAEIRKVDRALAVELRERSTLYASLEFLLEKYFAFTIHNDVLNILKRVADWGDKIDIRLAFSHPPKMAEFMFHRLIPKKIREEVIGDLSEDYKFIYGKSGFIAARRQYYQQMLRSVFQFVWASVLRVSKRTQRRVWPE